MKRYKLWKGLPEVQWDLAVCSNEAVRGKKRKTMSSTLAILYLRYLETEETRYSGRHERVKRKLKTGCYCREKSGLDPRDLGTIHSEEISARNSQNRKERHLGNTRI